MQVVRGARAVAESARHAAVAIGNFDGVHRGHQALIATARSIGTAARRPFGVVVFEPHPRVFFQPTAPLFQLTPLERKLTLIAALGAEVAIVLDFDAALAGLSAEAFVFDVLARDLAISHLVAGYDFRFGKGRAGTPDMLRAKGAEAGFGVTILEPVSAGGEVFSSSAVRERLARGDVAGAATILGHRWRVSGEVVGGAKRGTGLGFPTANVTMPAGTVLGHGIYAARVLVDGERHEAAAYFGNRPTFDNGRPVLEVFLFDFDGNLYGKTIEVEFIGFVRGDAKFEGVEALILQMQADCDAARAMIRELTERDSLAGLPLAGV